MSDRRTKTEKTLRILVVDDKPFQRRLTIETLRQMRSVVVEHVESADHCIETLPLFAPDIIVTTWDMDGSDGVAMTARIRAGECGETFRRVPIVVVTERGRPSDIDRARSSGVNEFVQTPFSTATLLRRVRETQRRIRDFVESAKYVGPCRRRRASEIDYDGPRRRLFDSNDKQADAPDVQIRKGLARMYCERIGELLKALKPGDADALRDLGLTSGQLSALAGDMKDRLLMSACSSLFNYVKGVGAGHSLNAEVVQAHLDSIVQLAELPDSQVELRQTVTQQLTVMVTKKLRQAGGRAA
ncbi:MAG: response regulator [Hyphomonadaceae bacterium]|nr:response regulator [Hyphomonadaceae bacterium]